MFVSLVIQVLLLSTGEVDLAEVESLLPERDTPEIALRIDRLISGTLEKHPNDFEALVAACRWKSWLADGETGQRKRRLGKEAWDSAEQALNVKPADPRASYCAALGIGAYWQAVGILQAIFEGLEGKFNERLKVALRRAPELDHGGPLMVKGRYHYELPWPKRDIGASLQYFEQAIAAHPVNLRTRLFWAEALLKNGDKERASMAVEEVLAGSVEYDPPEGRRVQSRAKQLQLRMAER